VRKFVLIFVTLALVIMCGVVVGAEILPIPSPKYSADFVFENTYFHGILTIEVPSSAGNNIALVVFKDDPNGPIIGTAESPGNILYFNIINALDEPKTVSIPVPREHVGNYIVVRAGANDFDVIEYKISTKVKIVAIETPATCTMNVGTSLGSVLPKVLRATMDNGSSIFVGVTWDTGSYTGNAGNYIFSGQVSTDNDIQDVIIPDIQLKVYGSSGGGGSSSGGADNSDSDFNSDNEGNEDSPEKFIIVKFVIGEYTFQVNDEMYEMDVQTFYDEAGARTLFPIRFLPEALGYTVDWQPDGGVVTISKEGYEVKLVVGSNIMHINAVAMEMDTNATIIADRTYIPIRFVANSLGFAVGFDSTTQTVTLVGTQKVQ